MVNNSSLLRRLEKLLEKKTVLSMFLFQLKDNFCVRVSLLIIFPSFSKFSVVIILALKIFCLSSDHCIFFICVST